MAVLAVLTGVVGGDAAFAAESNQPPAPLPHLSRLLALRNTRPVTLTIVGFGSSVGVGATLPDPSTQAPVMYVGARLKAAFQSAEKLEVVSDNRSLNGSILSQFLNDVPTGNWNAYLKEGKKPTLVVFAYGMNDGFPALYNASQPPPFFHTQLVAAIRLVQAAGADPVILTSPHPISTVAWAMPATYSQAYPAAVPAPVGPEQMTPPASRSVVLQDPLGSGRRIPVSLRHMHINQVMREAARETGCAVIDAERCWFEAVADRGGDAALFDARETVHPNLLGHQVSYQKAIDTFVASLAASLLAGTASVAAAAETLPVLVFAGQSNANGFGMPSQLPAALREAQPNVLFNNAYVNAAPAWAPLVPPTEPGSRYQFGNQYNLDYADGAFGPELTTGLGISAALGGKQLALVKYSLGATSLAVDWNPDNPQGWKLYPSMVTAVNASVTALRAQHPGKNVQIAGFFWMQGESDFDGPLYQANLTNFIARVRQDFGNPTLPFIIGQLGAMWAGNAIAQAQAAVATPGRPTYVHDTRLVATADLPVIFDNMHFNAAGVQKLGDRYAAAYEALTGLPVQDVGASPADANLLSGQDVVASSQYGGHLASAATDGTAAQHVFADNDGAMRLVIHGLNSALQQLRIFRSTTDTNRVPAQVTIRSSTSDNAALTDTFETLLIPAMALGPAAFTDGCLTINVDAPTGTRSLYFDFGGTDANGSPHGDRIVEIQAFATRKPAAPAAP